MATRSSRLAWFRSWCGPAVHGRALLLTIVLGGSYAPTRERTADLHVHVFRAAIARARAAGGLDGSTARHGL